MTAAPLSVPVAFFIFNRPRPASRVFEAIRAARPAKLFVVADGPRSKKERTLCEEARSVRVDWPCEVLTEFSGVHLGCKRRVSSGLRWVFSLAEEAVILEDDCVPSRSFFSYCEELLRRYRHDPRVTTIGGSNFGFPSEDGAPAYRFSRFMNMWGWATWRRAVDAVDFEMKDWPAFRGSRRFRDSLGGDPFWIRYLSARFDETHAGRVDTWDYQWVFSNLRGGGLAAWPRVNMVHNLGYGEGATHTRDAENPLSRLGAGETPFPLVHPPEIVPSEEYDRFLKEAWAGSGRPSDSFFTKIRKTAARFRHTAVLSGRS